MQRIAIMNQKGGVGKTTTTANLGAALARAGKRVLLADLDPQGHLSLHFGVELKPGDPSIYDVLTRNAPVDQVARDVGENTTLLPADVDLAGAEAELVSIMGREVLLREALADYDRTFDYLLIDCPPSLGVLTINALVAADEVLIPLQAHFLALQGLSKLLDTVTLVRQRINPGLDIKGVVLCMHEASTRLAGEVVEDIRGFLESTRATDTAWSAARVYNQCVRRNIKLAESSSFGQTVFDYAPKSNGAKDYAKLAEEVFGVHFPEQMTARRTDGKANGKPGAKPSRPRAAKTEPGSSAKPKVKTSTDDNGNDHAKPSDSTSQPVETTPN